MLFVAALKLIAIGYALVGAIRARYAPAVVLVVSFLATVVLPLLPVMGVAEQAVAAIAGVAWAPLLAAVLAQVPVTRHAFRSLDGARAGSPEEDAMSSAAYGLLGNTVIDAGLCTITILAAVLAARSAF